MRILLRKRILRADGRRRWALWQAPARLVRHARRNIVRILDGWPTATEILAAYRRIALIT